MERVHSDPNICSGKPVIRGTRVMVRSILSMLKAGKNVDEVLQAFPGLAVADVVAAASEQTRDRAG